MRVHQLNKEVGDALQKLIKHEVKEYLQSDEFQEHLEYVVKVAEYMLQRNILERIELEKIKKGVKNDT